MHTPHPSSPAPWRQLVLGVLVTLLTPGRLLAWAHHQASGLSVNNVYQGAALLPADLHRVLLLPLVAAGDGPAFEVGCATLQPVLYAELVRAGRFEVTTVAADRLAWRTGRAAWTGEEVLPGDFLAVLRQETGCEAVLFAQLVVYRPYTPLVVGWKLRLVDTRSQQTLWAAEEVFDAARPEVARAARAFDRADATGWAVLHAPRRFAAFAAAHLLATLPHRAPPKRVKVFLKQADEGAERRP